MDNLIAIETPTIDVAFIKRFLNVKPHFNISYIFKHANASACRSRTTLAYYAVQTNNEELLNFLIDSKVDLNISASCGFPLKLAVKKRNLKLVIKLHRAGANINARKSDHYSTPLIEAVMQRNLEITKYLISNGADVNAVTTQYGKLGHTAVVIAMSEGYDDIVELLLQNGADHCAKVDLSNLNVSGVKNMLSTTPSISINSIFICSKPLNYFPATLAHLAVRSKNEELLNYLLSSKVDLNISIPNQGTVLQVAIEMRDLPLVKKLCQFGADVNVPNNDMYPETPLILAVSQGYFEIVKYLLERGANPNAKLNSYGYKALHLAIHKKYTGIVKLLLKNNADPNDEEDVGFTPLKFACRTENLDVMKMLIAYGGSYDINVLRTALQTNTPQVLDFLLKLDVDEIDSYLTAEKSDNSILHYALIILRARIRSSFDYDKIKVLLDAGVNINCVNNFNKLAVEFTDVPKLLDLLKRHIVKLKQADFYICQRNIEAAKKGKYDIFCNECDEEIEKLKINKVGSSNLAFYGVLHKNSHSLAIRFIHTNIDAIVDKQKLLNGYPIYGGMIYYKLAKVQRRMRSLESVEQFLDYVLNYCLKLPYTFIRELYFYLTNEDLKKLM